MDIEKLELIKKNDLFQCVKDAYYEKISDDWFQFEDFEKDSVILEQGDDSTHLLLILEGEVRIYKEGKKGSSFLLNKCKSGEFIGELALIDNRKRSATAICASEVKAAFVSRKALFEIVKVIPRVLLNLTRTLGSRLWESGVRSAVEVEYIREIERAHKALKDKEESLITYNNKLKKAHDSIIKLEQTSAVQAMGVTAKYELAQPLSVIKSSFDLMKSIIKKKEVEDKLLDKSSKKIDDALDKIENILSSYVHIEKVQFEKYMDNMKIVKFQGEKEFFDTSKESDKVIENLIKENL